ncbi:MAG: VanZ family protein [Pseudomonadales bacterium]|nr:VanZ family protein [Pseudomonadales bacterium]
MTFHSARERRLWIWVAVIIGGIVLSMGWAQSLAGELRERGLLQLTFSTGLILVATSIVVQGLRFRPRGWEIALGIGVAATYLIVVGRMVTPEARSHLIEYSVLALFIYEALLERREAGGTARYVALMTIVITSLLGVLDECVQWFIPSRVFDPIDMLFNFLAATAAVSASACVTWLRRVVRRS